LTWIVCGCSSETLRVGVTHRDSAGVSIVESTLPRWGDSTGWIVDPAPTLDLTVSGEGEAHWFFLVSDAARLPDGTIVVADNGSDEVRYFSKDGVHLRSAGGSGDGPGEFRWPHAVDPMAGDSLLVFDPQLGRATILDHGGEVQRVFPVRLPQAQIWHLRPLDDSTLVARAPLLYEPEERDGLYRRPDALIRISLSGIILDTITATAGNEEFQGEAGGVSSVPLFLRDSHFAAFGGKVVVGDADEMEFIEYSPEGDVLRIVRAPEFDLTPSEEEIQAERLARLGLNPSERRRRLLAAMPDPVTKPAYSDLLIDSEGYLWAQESQGRAFAMTGGKPSCWNVFSPEGEWLGRVRIPYRFAVFEIGPDYVLGRLHDDRDVERVQLLKLHRS
jgi:hypothetical protein